MQKDYNYQLLGMHLTRREGELVRAFAQDAYTYADAAAALNTDVQAARQMGSRIMGKVGAQNITHLVFMICGRAPAPGNLIDALGILYERSPRT